MTESLVLKDRISCVEGTVWLVLKCGISRLEVRPLSRVEVQRQSNLGKTYRQLADSFYAESAHSARVEAARRQYIVVPTTPVRGKIRPPINYAHATSYWGTHLMAVSSKIKVQIQ